MTKEEFENGYAERSGLSVSVLRLMGLYARPCDCRDEICKGWKMLTNIDVYNRWLKDNE